MSVEVSPKRQSRVFITKSPKNGDHCQKPSFIENSADRQQGCYGYIPRKISASSSTIFAFENDSANNSNINTLSPNYIPTPKNLKCKLLEIKIDPRRNSLTSTDNSSLSVLSPAIELERSSSMLSNTTSSNS